MIAIYDAAQTDFSANGLGTLVPATCVVKERLNGDYELQMLHPLDVAGKWTRIKEGRIIVAPVPAATTPAISTGTAQTGGTPVYKVDTQRDPLRLRSGPGTGYKIIGRYAKGTEVIVLSTADADWYEVVCPDGKRGYMRTTYLAYVRTQGTQEDAVQTVVKETQMRTQPFRIYRVVPELDGISVYARHISYDLMDNMIKRVEPTENMTGAQAVAAIKAACLMENEFAFFSDLDSVYAPAEDEETAWENTNPLEALLGDDGVSGRYKGELARDWYDLYMVKRVGKDRGVSIREGKNLLGISYDVDISDVATRIMPTGEDEDGNVLYLPETYVDSERIGDYPKPRWQHLNVAAAREVKSGDDKRTKEECYEMMREAARAEFEKGCDLPVLTVKVNFVNLAQTVEYAAYKVLQNIYLGDGVSVYAKRLNIAVTLRMVEYTFDCLKKQYTAMTLGTPEEALDASTITSRQLASGSVVAGKLAPGSVGTGNMQSGSVGSLQLKALAVDISHIKQAAIDVLNAQSITALVAKIEQIAAEKLTTDELYAALAEIMELRVGEIDAGNITTDTLAAVLGDFVKLYSETAGFDFATIKDLQAGTAIIEKGVNGKLYVADLAVTEANMVSLTVGELIVKGSDGRFYTIGIDADGNVTTTVKQVENDDVGDLSINAGEKLIEGSVTAKTLNAQEIFADSALIRELIAANLDVGTLFAREATIAQLNAIDISGNEFLRLMAREEIRFEVDPLKSAVDAVQQTADDANATAANVRTWMTFDTDGLKQGKSGSNYSTLIDDVGFHILQKDEKISSFAKRQLAVEEVRVGKVDTTQTRCVLREAGDGGMIITVEGLT